MPFKRNRSMRKHQQPGPLRGCLPRVAWTAAHSLLERTLDDSANRRLILPQAFLAHDEC